ncbi:MAG: hypothetical protein AAFR22_03730 [Chloroflexota bacterium]
MPVSGGTPTRLNGDLPDGGTVVSFYLISPDSSTVVYLAEQDTADVWELYSVPIVGGTPVKLNVPLSDGEGVGVGYAQISADSSTVVYLANSDRDSRSELYSVPIDGGVSVKLSDAASDNSDVWLYHQISPDSSTVIYLQGPNFEFDLYSVPISGGTPAKLNGTQTDVGNVESLFFISANSSTVVYAADPGNFEWELYSVPIGGGTPVKLNIPLSDGGYVDSLLFQVSADGTTVVYTAAVGGPNPGVELYSVPIGGGTSVKLNGMLPDEASTFDVTSVFYFQISPDSSTVVYSADQDTANTFELYSVPIGGGQSTKLNAPFVGTQMVVSAFNISDDSSTVIYGTTSRLSSFNPVEGLYTVPIEGGFARNLQPQDRTGSFLNTSGAGFGISPDNSTIIFVFVDDSSTARPPVYDLYSAHACSGSVVPFNLPIVEGGVIVEYQITPDGERVVYLADQDTDNVRELYSVRIDEIELTFNYDSTNDGIVAPSDAIYTLNRMGDQVDAGNGSADVDCNGVINAADAELVIEQIGQRLD